MAIEKRSACPINLSVELLGDRWTLIVLRDVIFGGRRHFRELLTASDEHISSSILAERLKTLVEEGLLTNAGDPSHKQRTTYSLTEKAIELVPILALLGGWGSRHLPVSDELSVRARMLETGGADMWEQFMSELRQVHLQGVPVSASNSVAATLAAAYEEVRARSTG